MSIIILKQRCLESKANRKEFVRTPATNTCVTVCVISVRENTDNCLCLDLGQCQNMCMNKTERSRIGGACQFVKTEDPDTIANVLFCNA